MDPLSITASCIAVLGALSASGKGISKLISLRHAPEDLQELSNEVESLRLLISQVHECFLSLHGSQVYLDHGHAVLKLLERTRRPVQDLQAIIEYQILKVDGGGGSTPPTVSRRAWLKVTSDIVKHRKHLRDAREDLILSMTALNIHMGGMALREQALQIQSISVVSQRMQTLEQTVRSPFPAAVTENGTGLTTQAARSFAQIAGGITQQQQSASSASSPQGQSVTQSGTVAALFPGNPNETPGQQRTASYLRVTATTNTRSCPKACRCQCHITTHAQTPRLLRGLLGQLFFSYTGLLRSTPCNYPPCQKSANKSQFIYYFPTWLAARALTIAGHARDITGPDSSWALRIPIVVSSSDAIWYSAEEGNIALLQNIFSTKHNPWIIDEWGQSLLHRVNDLDTWRFLLCQHADPTIEDNDGTSALAHQLLHFDARSLKILHESDEQLEILMDDLCLTKLHASAAQLPGWPAITHELLEQERTDVSTSDRTGMTPLHWACLRGNSSAIELLLKWMANPAAQDRSGWTCLHHAAWSDDVDSVKLILAAGCEADTVDAQGQTAIFLTQEPMIIELLATYDVSIDRRDVSERTPLQHSLLAGFGVRGVEKFVSFGADIYATDIYGYDAIQYAITRHRAQELRCLFSPKEMSAPLKASPRTRVNINGCNDLHLAAFHAGVEVMQVLATAHLQDPTIRDKDGDTPTDCFYLDRDENCTMIRPPFEEEEQAWWALMEAACEQNDIDFETFEPEWWDKYCARPGILKEVSSDEDEADWASSVHEAEEAENDEFKDAVENQSIDARVDA